jgi:hypothetical protein
LTVLLLHQTKFPPPAQSPLLGPKVDSTAMSKDAVLHLGLTPIHQKPIESPTGVNSIKPKTLMELAQGGFDLLDGESTTSKSALENTDIQTECVIDCALPDHMSLTSLAQMNTPPKQLVFA